MRRRELLVMSAAAIASFTGAAPASERQEMFGLIGKITAAPGKRDELIAILLGGTERMPGCLSYIVARDAADADAIWVTEVWESAARHAESLSLPAVRAAIARGRPLIAGFSNRVETVPVGGLGVSGA